MLTSYPIYSTSTVHARIYDLLDAPSPIVANRRQKSDCKSANLPGLFKIFDALDDLVD